MNDLHGTGKAVFLILLLEFALLCGFPGAAVNAQNTDPQWQRIGPGGGGATFIPTFSYQNTSDFLLRCDMTGSYHSKDGGQSYEQYNFPNGASAFAYDPSDSNTILIGSNTLNRSIDGGKTWERLFPTADNIVDQFYFGDHANFQIITSDDASQGSGGSIQSIRIDPVNPSNIYFGLGNVLYHSNDRGKSWQKTDVRNRILSLYTNSGNLKSDLIIFTAEKVLVLDKKTGKISARPLPSAMQPAFSFTAGTVSNDGMEIFYALRHDPKKEIQEEFGYSEVWTSEDIGKSWKKSKNPFILNSESGVNPSYSMISCAEKDARHAYLVTNRYEEKKAGGSVFWYGALKTDDAGKSWNWVWKGGGGSGRYGVKDGIDATNLKDAWARDAFGGEYIRLMDVGVAPQNGDVAIVTDWYRTMKTTDGGKSWSEIYSRKQPDGTYKSRGLDVTTSYGVHFDPFDSTHLAISYTDIGFHHSFDRGKSWVRSVAGVPTEWVNTCYWAVFDPVVKGRMWSAWSGMHDYPRGKMTRDPSWKQRAKGGICRSDDGGKSWRPVTEGIGPDSPATCIVLDPTSPPENRTLYASIYSKGVIKSTDNGKSWQLNNNGIEENTCAFEITRTSNGTLFLTVSPTPAHRGMKKGREFFSGAVYRSTDNAETWTKLKVSDGKLFPNGIEFDPANPDRIYLAGWADIQLSDLIGGDVARTTGGNEKIEIPGGIFLSEDNGNTWTSIFDKKQYVYDVTADPAHPGRLYCNTFNGAAYRSDDAGKKWNRIKGYDFHWGQRISVDRHDPEKIYINTYGSSVWYGKPDTEDPANPSQRNDRWGFAGFGGGGAMFSPTVSPHNPQRAFVSCDMTGSYATYDGGKHWRMFNLKGPVDFYVFDPIDSNTVYANSVALFKSTDRGNTWALHYPQPSAVSGFVSKGDHGSERVVTLDSTLRRVRAFAVDPADSKKLYAAISVDGKTAFYASRDGGNTWEMQQEIENDIKNIFVHPQSDPANRTIYVCGEHGVARRENGIWTAAVLPGGVKKFNQYSGGFDRKKSRYFLYAISGNSYFNPESDASGIYYSKNGGKTWENRQDGLAGKRMKGSKMPEWRCIATSERNPEVVYISYAGLKSHADTTYIGVARSSDYGKTWQLVWKDRLTRNGNIAAPNFEREWINERFGPTWGENPFAIGVSPADPDICYATDFGRTVRSVNGGKYWEQVYTNKKEGGGWSSRGLEVTTSYTIAFDPFEPKHVFIANTDIGLMESHDGGESWLSATLNNGIPREWMNSTYWLEFDPGTKGRIWAAMSGSHDLPRPKMWRKTGTKDYKGGVLRSDDSGKTWTPVSADIGEGGMTHVLIDRSSPIGNRTLYTCVFGKGVYKSIDDGKTWHPKNKGILEQEPFAWRIFQRESDNHLFLVVSRRSEDGSIGTPEDGAVYHSTDGAETWKRMLLPEGVNGPTSLIVDPGNDRRLLLSAWGRATGGKFSNDIGGGIFASDDSGRTWKQVLKADQHIHDLTYDARNKTFYACGFNGSAYRSENGGTSWSRIKGYNFKWGKRVVPDPRDAEKIFIITFGGGVWYGPAKGDPTALEDILP